jgi:DNA repair protein RadD
MRLSPGKTDCLVLDFGGNVERHGPITHVKPKSQGQDVMRPGVKDCPQCSAEVPHWRRECPECLLVFPIVPREVEHEKTASRASIMSAERPESKAIAIDSTTYAMHTKRDKPPSMRVTYSRQGRSVVSEWVCLEHEGFARKKACGWWAQHGGLDPVPETIEEALGREGELLHVTSVVVEADGDFERVKTVTFGARREPGSDDVAPSEPVSDGWAYEEDDLPF